MSARGICSPAHLAFAIVLCATAANAQSWAPAPGEARALLPAPNATGAIAGAELVCDAQIWTLALRRSAGGTLNAAARAQLTIGTRSFDAERAEPEDGSTLIVPPAALDAMRIGSRLTVEIGDDTATFSLSGSLRAIAAAEELCTPRVMPTENSVGLTPYSSYLALAEKLRADDIADFSASTTIRPRTRAGMVELDGGRRLLFAELCGSSWYYGTSGCSLAGFAPQPGGDPEAASGWRQVYETEGVFLYVDPDNDVDGWPDLRAIPLKEGDEMRWRWTGDGYAPAANLLEAQGGTGVIEGLRR